MFFDNDLLDVGVRVSEKTIMCCFYRSTQVKNNNLAAKAQGERMLRMSMESIDPHIKHRFQGL